MRKPPLSFLVSIFPILLNAQKDLPDQKWAISFTPAVIPITGNWQVGIQPGILYQLSAHVSLSTAVTFQTGKNNNSDPSFMNKRYLRIKPEIRYFFSMSKEVREYIGLQFSYTMRKFTSKYGYYYDHLPGDSVVYFDQATINSPIITASIQLGNLVAIGKSFMLDFFIGLGARSTNTEYKDVINPQVLQKIEHPGGWRVPLPIPSYYYREAQVRFHSNFGIGILYFFPRG